MRWSRPSSELIMNYSMGSLAWRVLGQEVRIRHTNGSLKARQPIVGNPSVASVRVFFQAMYIQDWMGLQMA